MLLVPLQETEGQPTASEAVSLRLEVDGVWPTTAPGCPFPIRIKIENTGPARDIEFAVAASSDYYSGSASVDVTRRLRLDERERAQLSILVPAMQGSTTLRVRVDGQDIKDFQHFIYARGSGVKPNLVVDSRRTFTEPEIEAAFPLPSYSGNGSSCVLLSPQRLPDQWQAYAGIGEIWIHAPEWASASPEVRQALLKAVKAGQRVAFYATTAPEAELEKLLSEGKASTTGSDAQTECRVGWGKVIGIPREIIGGDPSQRPDCLSGPSATQRLQSYRAPLLGGVGRAPHVAFFWIVFLFSLLIGPGNLILCRILRNRMLFVVTTPVIAVVAVVTLFSYSILREGIGIKAAVHSITLLDPKAKESVSFSTMMVYTGLSTGMWQYKADTLCVNVVDAHTNINRACTLDWSRGQDWGGGWVPPRVPVTLRSVQVSPDRSRLGMERLTGGGLRLHNGLGGAITEGVIMWEGKLLAIPSIADGASGEATGIAQKPPKPALFPAIHESSINTLPSSTFIVLLDRPPGLDLGGKSFQDLGSTHLVRGTVTE